MGVCDENRIDGKKGIGDRSLVFFTACLFALKQTAIDKHTFAMRPQHCTTTGYFSGGAQELKISMLYSKNARIRHPGFKYHDPGIESIEIRSATRSSG